MTTCTRYIVGTPPDAGGFVWRMEIEAVSESDALFIFMRRWLGEIISRDLRPSDIEVIAIGAGKVLTEPLS
jgi:hypothetical protein